MYQSVNALLGRFYLFGTLVSAGAAEHARVWMPHKLARRDLICAAMVRSQLYCSYLTVDSVLDTSPLLAKAPLYTLGMVYVHLKTS